MEGLVVYTPGFFQQDNPPLGIDGEVPPDIVASRTLALMGNVVLTTPRSWNKPHEKPAGSSPRTPTDIRLER